jgi:hypothetical protein
VDQVEVVQELDKQVGHMLEDQVLLVKEMLVDHILLVHLIMVLVVVEVLVQ